MHFEFYYDSSEFNETIIKKIINTCNSFLKYYFKITFRMITCFIIKSDASIKIFYPSKDRYFNNKKFCKFVVFMCPCK